jgi:hypothetical protein
VLPKIRARHRQRRADEAAVGLCACESGGSRRGPARLRERRRAREGLEERDARPLGCRLPKDALVERVAAKCSRLCAYRWSGYSSPCTRKMKMQRGLKKPLESVSLYCLSRHFATNPTTTRMIKKKSDEVFAIGMHACSEGHGRLTL